MVALRVAGLLFSLLIAQALYFQGAGLWARYFTPQWLTLSACFLGALFGSWRGMIAAAALGAIEELGFVEVPGAFGPTAFIYLWCAFAAGRMLYERFDWDNYIAGAIASACGLAMSYGGAILWILIFDKRPVFFPTWGWAAILTFWLHVFIIGPLVFRLFLKASRRGRLS